MPDREKVLAKFTKVFDNHRLTNMGPLSLELEERIASMLGVKHCICVCMVVAHLTATLRFGTPYWRALTSKYDSLMFSSRRPEEARPKLVHKAPLRMHNNK